MTTPKNGSGGLNGDFKKVVWIALGQLGIVVGWGYKIGSDLSAIKQQVQNVAETRASKEEVGRLDERVKFIESLIRVTPAGAPEQAPDFLRG